MTTSSFKLLHYRPYRERLSHVEPPHARTRARARARNIKRAIATPGAASSRRACRSSSRSRSSTAAGASRSRTSSSKATSGCCARPRSSTRRKSAGSRRTRRTGFAPRFASTSFAAIASCASGHQSRAPRAARLPNDARERSRALAEVSGLPASACAASCRSSGARDEPRREQGRPRAGRRSARAAGALPEDEADANETARALARRRARSAARPNDREQLIVRDRMMADEPRTLQELGVSSA